MINILICGANGHLGQTVALCAEKHEGITVTAGVDPYAGIENAFPVYDSIDKVKKTPDVIIDFSRPASLEANLAYAKKNICAIVIATTGFTPEQKKLIRDAAEEIPIFFAANMSLGVNLQMELAKSAAGFLGNDFDIEIIEKHHNRKVDAPSGTALAIAESINDAFMGAKEFKYGRTPEDGRRSPKEIGLHAVRGGTVVGEHEVGFYGNDEVITISHSAQSKQVFAMGALRAAEFICGKESGLYNMSDIIAESRTVTSMYTDEKQAIVTISGIPFRSECLAYIFSCLAQNEINIDIISQTMPKGGTIKVSFSLPKAQVFTAQSIISEAALKYRGLESDYFDDITKITIEGMGMERQSGVASKLFSCLAVCDVQILIITTSETKILLCIKKDDTQKALAAIAEEFRL